MLSSISSTDYIILFFSFSFHLAMVESRFTYFFEIVYSRAKGCLCVIPNLVVLYAFRSCVQARILPQNRLLAGWLIYWGSFGRQCHLLCWLQQYHLCSLSSSLRCSQSCRRKYLFGALSWNCCLLSCQCACFYLFSVTHSFCLNLFGVNLCDQLLHRLVESGWLQWFSLPWV